jgi:hypothetical protein
MRKAALYGPMLVCVCMPFTESRTGNEASIEGVRQR